MKVFSGILRNLEEHVAPSLLADKMKPFSREGGGDLFACPWLNWWKQQNGKIDNIQGILIMQDWYCTSDESESLETNVCYISEKRFLKQNDRTIFTLHNSGPWRNAIWDEKNWLVTNAVWGLRIGKNPAGCLSARIHKAAFPIWSQIIKHFANDDGFKVVFAGGWVFEKDKLKDACLKTYLNILMAWAGRRLDARETDLKTRISELNFESVKGKVYFCGHPSAWNANRNFLPGPPQV